MSDLPAHYFRIRETGALVFRLDSGNRDRRLELEPLAVINLRNGEVRPQGGRSLTPADEAAIADWVAERHVVLARRDADEVLRTVEALNRTAHWAQSQATPEEIEAATDALLLAMHDLRSVLVRRRAEGLKQAD